MPAALWQPLHHFESCPLPHHPTRTHSSTLPYKNSSHLRRPPSGSPCITWKIALCSLSAGRMLTPYSRASGSTKGPPAIRVSLFARQMSLPALMAATAGFFPEGLTAAAVAPAAGFQAFDNIRTLEPWTHMPSGQSRSAHTAHAHFQPSLLQPASHSQACPALLLSHLQQSMCAASPDTCVSVSAAPSLRRIFSVTHPHICVPSPRPPSYLWAAGRRNQQCL